MLQENKTEPRYPFVLAFSPGRVILVEPITSIRDRARANMSSKAATRVKQSHGHVALSIQSRRGENGLRRDSMPQKA